MDVRQQLREIATGQASAQRASEQVVRVSMQTQQQIKTLLDRPVALPRSPQSCRVLAP